jgi:hypothetical protein
MKVRVEYKLSEKGQRDAIRKGLDGRRYQKTVLDDPQNTMLESKIGEMETDGVMRFHPQEEVWIDVEYGHGNRYMQSNPVECEKWGEIIKDIIHTYGKEVCFRVSYREAFLDSPIITIADLQRYEVEFFESEEKAKKKIEELRSTVENICQEIEKEKQEKEKKLAEAKTLLSGVLASYEEKIQELRTEIEQNSREKIYDEILRKGGFTVTEKRKVRYIVKKEEEEEEN